MIAVADSNPATGEVKSVVDRVGIFLGVFLGVLPFIDFSFTNTPLSHPFIAFHIIPSPV